MVQGISDRLEVAAPASPDIEEVTQDVKGKGRADIQDADMDVTE